MEIFGKRLKQLRKENSMTQGELGELINVTKVSICCYEKGTRIPSLETLIDLSNVFKVDIDYLLGNDKYVIADNDHEYGSFISKEDIKILKEIKKNNKLYSMLLDNTSRTIELINKRIN